MGSSGEPFLGTYLPYLLRQADQALSAPFYAVLTEHGVARSEWRVLAVLAELGAMPVVDLAAAALSPQPTVTHALRRLEKRGLVARVNGTDDRRQRIASITDEGMTLTSALMADARQLEATTLANIDRTELTELITQLQALTHAIDTTDPEPARQGDR